jgi:hypothetical protein
MKTLLEEIKDKRTNWKENEDYIKAIINYLINNGKLPNRPNILETIKQCGITAYKYCMPCFCPMCGEDLRGDIPPYKLEVYDDDGAYCPFCRRDISLACQ